VGEEPLTRAAQVELVWIVDPLDGTDDFLHGYPQYAVSIGLPRRRETGGRREPRRVPQPNVHGDPWRWGRLRKTRVLSVSPWTEPRRALIGSFPFKR